MANPPEEGKNWQCPHCGQHQAVLSTRFDSCSARIRNDHSELGPIALRGVTVACANSACKKLTLTVSLVERVDYGNGSWEGGSLLQAWRLLPESNARPQPDYIPQPLRDDYYEACRIRDLSPKASATLARRAIQGLIRDYFKIARGTLDAEIRELRKQVEEGTAVERIDVAVIDAIDHVRSIGNIGAHMEKDINLIIDVEPDEAQLLIELVETLFDELYVAREKRRRRLADLAATANAKKLIKDQAKLIPPADEKLLPGPAP